MGIWVRNSPPTSWNAHPKKHPQALWALFHRTLARLESCLPLLSHRGVLTAIAKGEAVKVTSCFIGSTLFDLKMYCILFEIEF